MFVEDSLHRYVVEILNHTRTDTRLALGASPRAGIALLRVAKAHAVVRGRDYVVPADVKDVATDVLTHRVILAPEARTAGRRRGRLHPRGGRADAGPGMTQRGRRVLWLALGLYIAAWGFGTDAMFPVAVGLALAPAAAWGWVRLLDRPMRLRRRAGHLELVEGQSFAVGLEVTADGGPLPGPGGGGRPGREAAGARRRSSARGACSAAATRSSRHSAAATGWAAPSS